MNFSSFVMRFHPIPRRLWSTRPCPFVFPLIFFAIGGLVFAISDGLALAEWTRVIWVATIAGAMTGMPLWLFSLPWAFVVVYGLARTHHSMFNS